MIFITTEDNKFLTNEAGAFITLTTLADIRRAYVAIPRMDEFEAIPRMDEFRLTGD